MLPLPTGAPPPGSIVNIGSVHGRAGFNMWAAHDVAKGGVDAPSRYMAVEYGPVGICCNTIAPGGHAGESHLKK